MCESGYSPRSIGEEVSLSFFKEEKFHAWDQNSYFSRGSTLNMIIKGDHAIFFASFELSDIGTLEIFNGSLQVSHKCFARHLAACNPVQ